MYVKSCPVWINPLAGWIFCICLLFIVIAFTNTFVQHRAKINLDFPEYISLKKIATSVMCDIK